MSSSGVNRHRQQMANFDRILQKKSGDQHIEPMDDGSDAPHRPHRVNREDQQKVLAPKRDEDENI